VGFVTLRFERGRWRIRYRDASGRDIRTALPVATEGDAFDAAVEANRELLNRRKPAGMRTPAAAGVTVSEALQTAIRSTRLAAITENRYVRAANAFLAWLERTHPAVRRWADVRPSHLVEYLHGMEARGLSFDGCRNALYPVRRAAAYWAAEEPDTYRDIAKAAGRRLRLDAPAAGGQPVALDAGQLRTLLEWLAEHDATLYGLATLQGCCGLRLFEAAFLRVRDVDAGGAVLTVAATPWHSPKTDSSARTIPIPALAVAALRPLLDTTAAPDAPLFVNRCGRPWTENSIIGRWQRTLAVARLSMPWLSGFKPKALRATFATLAVRAGADRELVRRYLGHIQRGVLERHYERVSVDCLRAGVVAPFEAVMVASLGTNLAFGAGRALQVVEYQGTAINA